MLKTVNFLEILKGIEINIFPTEEEIEADCEECEFRTICPRLLKNHKPILQCKAGSV